MAERTSGKSGKLRLKTATSSTLCDCVHWAGGEARETPLALWWTKGSAFSSGTFETTWTAILRRCGAWWNTCWLKKSTKSCWLIRVSSCTSTSSLSNKYSPVVISDQKRRARWLSCLGFSWRRTVSAVLWRSNSSRGISFSIGCLVQPSGKKQKQTKID